MTFQLTQPTSALFKWDHFFRSHLQQPAVSNATALHTFYHIVYQVSYFNRCCLDVLKTLETCFQSHVGRQTVPKHNSVTLMRLSIVRLSVHASSKTPSQIARSDASSLTGHASSALSMDTDSYRCDGCWLRSEPGEARSFPGIIIIIMLKNDNNKDDHHDGEDDLNLNQRPAIGDGDRRRSPPPRPVADSWWTN